MDVTGEEMGVGDDDAAHDPDVTADRVHGRKRRRHARGGRHDDEIQSVI